MACPNCGTRLWTNEDGDRNCPICARIVYSAPPKPSVPIEWKHFGTKRGPTGTSRRSVRNGG